MQPPRLKKGDVIGLASPSWAVSPQWSEPVIAALEQRGYRVRCGQNLHASAWGYAASAAERAADLNQLIRDPEVRMVFFGGGEGADDVLPLLDYDAIRQKPKLYLSYSDGTSILNAVWAAGGSGVLYGQMPGLLPHMAAGDYNERMFRRFTEGFPEIHERSAPWHTLTPGVARGTLLGGYLMNFIFLCATGRIPRDRKYVLCLEDHRQFFGIEAESAWIGRLEQCGIMPCVTGILFGHYASPVEPYLLQRLRQLGEKWRIPVAYCDDFGHADAINSAQAILPLGADAELDTAAQTLRYRYP